VSFGTPVAKGRKNWKRPDVFIATLVVQNKKRVFRGSTEESKSGRSEIRGPGLLEEGGHISYCQLERSRPERWGQAGTSYARLRHQDRERNLDRDRGWTKRKCLWVKGKDPLMEVELKGKKKGVPRDLREDRKCAIRLADEQWWVGDVLFWKAEIGERELDRSDPGGM